ncbi:hypothetical protein DRN67_03175, partial [Candidatus Micrarchaeota archaeon]
VKVGPLHRLLYLFRPPKHEKPAEPKPEVKPKPKFKPVEPKPALKKEGVKEKKQGPLHHLVSMIKPPSKKEAKKPESETKEEPKPKKQKLVAKKAEKPAELKLKIIEPPPEPEEQEEGKEKKTKKQKAKPEADEKKEPSSSAPSKPSKIKERDKTAILVQYIKKCFEQGYDEQQIWRALIDSGWSVSEITAGFKAAEQKVKKGSGKSITDKLASSFGRKKK